jgi:hypothetical protein
VDLWTSDVERSRSFYSEVFGWEAQEPSPECGGYFMFTRNGVPIAGGMGDMGDLRANNSWKVFLATDDVAKTVELAEAAGAHVAAPPMTIADLGAQAVLVDPAGAPVGVWEPRSFPGFTVLAEHGAPGWFELLTRDYQASIDFYRSVFHWETKSHSDTEAFRYTMAYDPATGTELAGIMDASGFLPEGTPAAWSIFFGVADADAAATRIEQLGGTVSRAPEDTPYGRLATVADPMGAQFKLVAPNEAMPARS